MDNLAFATLVNGATVISTSPHGFRFSDGTECAGNKVLAEKLSAKRKFEKVGEIKGMPLNKVSFVLNREQLNLLNELCGRFDIVIIPFPLLATLREMGVRDNFPNAVAFNSTVETMRSSPQDKIVDIYNWSY